MKIELRAYPGAKKNLVKEVDGFYKVYMQAPALDGRANEALIKVLAEHFGVKRSEIELIKGLKSRHKTVTINALKYP